MQNLKKTEHSPLESELIIKSLVSLLLLLLIIAYIKEEIHDPLPRIIKFSNTFPIENYLFFLELERLNLLFPYFVALKTNNKINSRITLDKNKINTYVNIIYLIHHYWYAKPLPRLNYQNLDHLTDWSNNFFLSSISIGFPSKNKN